MKHPGTVTPNAFHISPDYHASAGPVGSFIFNDTATPEIYTLSLHDALPISSLVIVDPAPVTAPFPTLIGATSIVSEDRKSTRLNSSHTVISYAVFCLKKKTE